ncbi:hypothetical protein GCM10009716_02920 [Streptomyces sodiiphilus]|uniref:Deoxyribonuclease NucA/NucB domain-containing protein n=1 Tax=Streptomyces sodiiphilus TaxID=226217 RepID=A0ABN2NSR5_9ACTN
MAGSGGGRGKGVVVVTGFVVAGLVGYGWVWGGGGQPNETVEIGGETFLVPAGEGERLAECTDEQVVEDRLCGGLDIVVVDAARMPFVARNIALAWREGHPSVLTRDADRTRAEERREAACPAGGAVEEGGSCEAYPFPGTREGGARARTETVPEREALCRDGTLTGGFQLQGIGDGERFRLVIRNPGDLAERSWTGTDIARDTDCGV